jgi:hypothetical protein
MFYLEMHLQENELVTVTSKLIANVNSDMIRVIVNLITQFVTVLLAIIFFLIFV